MKPARCRFVLWVLPEFPGLYRNRLVAKQFASRLSLISFAVAILRGLIDGSDFEGTMRLALLVMVLFYVLGLAIGTLARQLIEETVQQELTRMAASSTHATEDSTNPA